MGVVAKGARAGKSRFGSTLEPMSHINVIIYCKPGRELQNLTEATHLHTHAALRTSLDRIETGLRIVELTSSLLQAEQVHPQVFSLLAASLTALENAPARTSNIWPFFQLRLATILGFGPSFDGDSVKSFKEEQGILDLKTGDILERSQADSDPFHASRAALRAFAVLSRAQLSDIVRMELTPVLSREVDSMVVAYLKYHVEDAYPDRTERVFAQLTPKN